MRKLLFIGLVLMGFCANAQDVEKPFRHVVYASVGPNVYLNNFEQFKDFVNERHYSIGARMMWEYEHKVSLGIKTGFYWIYTVDFTGANQAKISLTGVPIQFAMSMKVYKGFHIFYGLGPTILYNNITSNLGEHLSDSFVSTGDMSGGIGYITKTTNKISFGGEAEFFHSGKAGDNLINISFLVRLPVW